MGLNEQPSAERLHIGFFGLRNAGKSSVVNAVTGQQISLVSDIKGTTTDPVQKSMELLPLGPVVIIDTPGIDDEGALGELRVKRALQVLTKTDIAVLVIDACKGFTEADRELTQLFAKQNIPYITVFNKCELLEELPELKENELYVSALQTLHIHELKEMIGRFAAKKDNPRVLVSDLLAPEDVVLLVTPIDSAAPKGRLILPQQQTIRDILDANAITMTVKETQLPAALHALATPPRMVITDSQVFGKVDKETPADIQLTSFSILMARYKGYLNAAVRGAARLKSLKDGDTVLISEGCTHHRQCGDIGTVKLPAWIKNYTGCNLNFQFTSGGEFPEDLSAFTLVVHCGGCMLNEREMLSRIKRCEAAGVPITNYGVAIAEMHGILRRALSPFEDVRKLYEDTLQK